MKASEEVDGAAVVASGDVSEVFELVDEALDAIAQAIGKLVMRDDDVARAFGRDDCFRSGRGDEIA